MDKAWLLNNSRRLASLPTITNQGEEKFTINMLIVRRARAEYMANKFRQLILIRVGL